MMSKEGRLFEIYFLFGLVNSYTMYCEMRAQHEYSSRMHYLNAILNDPSQTPSKKYPLRTEYVVELRDALCNIDCSNDPRFK